MACLFRVFVARYRHWNQHQFKKTKDRTYLVFGKMQTMYRFFGLPGIYLTLPSDTLGNALPLAEKYVLVGDETVVQNVKDQIVAEFERPTVKNIWYSRQNIKIKIINEVRYYEDLEYDPIKNIGLVLCATPEADHKTESYCLPKNMPSTIKSQIIIMENPHDPELLEQSLTDLKNTELVYKHFKVSDVKVVNPFIDPKYKGLDDGILQSIFFFLTQAFRIQSR